MNKIELPKSRKKHLMSCHIAGRQFHDADEVWNELKIGTKLHLVADRENRYDKSAIAICYQREGDEVYVLGYIPRTENTKIYTLIDMGWSDIFECRLSKIDQEACYEQQLHITISILRNSKSN